MKIILVILLLFVASFSNAQKGLQFQEYVHDFGHIIENNGLVGHEFVFTNTSQFPAIINDITTSCGCAGVSFEKDSLSPNEESAILVIYDPMNRPGKFTKSVDISYSVDGTSQKSYVNIKGLVLPKKYLDVPKTNQLEKNVVEQLMLNELNLSELEENKEYNRFISSNFRLYLEERKLNITIDLGGIGLTEEFSANFKNRLIHDLLAQGIDTLGSSVLIGKQNSKSMVDYIELKSVLIRPEIASIIDDKVTNEPLKKLKTLPKQDLKTHIKHLYGNYNNRLDFDDKELKLLLKQVKSETKKGKVIRILIESSASNSPTSGSFSNEYVARFRATETKRSLKAYFKSNGIPDSMIVYTEPITLIQGPKYRRGYFSDNFYRKFQYLKIVPLYETDFQFTQNKLSPYSINFNEGKSEIPKSSPVFQQFISNLIPVINQQGFVELVIEASTSRIPSSRYKYNDVLAFYRAETSRQTILDEVAAKGLDSNKVVFRDISGIVQGPKYENDREENYEKYSSFQYIKIIPYALLK